MSDDNRSRTILVVGATGQQGGAVARKLLEGGWRVRVLTRDADSDKARALASAGAEVVEGDLNSRESLDRAVAGAYGVFSVVNFWLPGIGFEGEVRQGKTIADAAKSANARHFVYSSVGGAERNTGIPHFESKWQVEQHIRELGLPATIFRPVAFMENYYFTRDAILNGTLSQYGVRPSKTVQLIAVEDIAAFVALAFERPEEFIGKELEIAGEELTMPQQAEIIGRVIGRPVLYVQTLPEGDWNRGEEARRMTRWFDEEGYKADIPALRRLHPEMMNLETWLRRMGWEGAARLAA
ncbi:MAG TPA: NmrA/HSCARG family protein [Chloroflexota bacterium]|nr:NmrA/HSCARG family protein [Chloroflexota bacterium]